ncbi:MAG: aspartate dehydrogenase [Alphaproteobacteria bacterium CG_4_9_14_3_um_filter_47_13]|nr:MAG: aspartate dehydrogenase [Alphaproteobacteria bacterium CG_4_9_14_3_um_filter_47_13]
MTTIAVAGAGAIGAAVCRALIDGIEGFSLTAASSLDPDDSRARIARPEFSLPFVDLQEIPSCADWIVEALPLAEVPKLTEQVMKNGKTLVMISSAALLLYPELKNMAGKRGGKILVPSGALAGLDGIAALAETGIKSVRLVSTKPPKAFAGAPYIAAQNIDLAKIEEVTTIFSGNALQAAAAFPANVNVAATLSLASHLPPEELKVTVKADPALTVNRHEVMVESLYSTLHFTIENRPDPVNPKSSALAALSIIAALKRQSACFQVGS